MTAPNTDNFSKKLGEILVDGKGLDENRLRPRLMKGGVYGYEISVAGLAELHQAIIQLFDKEVIGEDDEMLSKEADAFTGRYTHTQPDNATRYYRNQLRATQRAILNGGRGE